MSERASIPALIIDALETYSRDYCFEDSEHAIAIDAFLRGVQPMSEWIDVKDRQPGTFGQYIVHLVDANDPPPYVTAKYWNGERFLTNFTVTHWMPLPEPPK